MKIKVALAACIGLSSLGACAQDGIIIPGTFKFKIDIPRPVLIQAASFVPLVSAAQILRHRLTMPTIETDKETLKQKFSIYGMTAGLMALGLSGLLFAHKWFPE